MNNARHVIAILPIRGPGRKPGTSLYMQRVRVWLFTSQQATASTDHTRSFGALLYSAESRRLGLRKPGNTTVITSPFLLHGFLAQACCGPGEAAPDGHEAHHEPHGEHVEVGVALVQFPRGEGPVLRYSAHVKLARVLGFGIRHLSIWLWQLPWHLVFGIWHIGSIGIWHLAKRSSLNSVSDMVSKVWYRSPFIQSELSISKIPPTDSSEVRPGRHP